MKIVIIILIFDINNDYLWKIDHFFFYFHHFLIDNSNVLIQYYMIHNNKAAINFTFT